MVTQQSHSVNHIFDAVVKQNQTKQEVAEVLKQLKKPYKFLEEKYSTNSAIDIFGDYVVTFTGLRFMQIDDNVMLFVLRDPSLAESYKIWFRLIFDLLPL